MKCCVIGCESNKGFRPSLERVSYYTLFRNGKIRDHWIEAIKLLNDQIIPLCPTLKHYKICSRHFEKCYLKDYCTKVHIAPNAIPTLFPKNGMCKPDPIFQSAEFLSLEQSVLKCEIEISQEPFAINTGEERYDADKLRKQNDLLRRVIKQHSMDYKILTSKLKRKNRKIQYLQTIINSLKMIL